MPKLKVYEPATYHIHVHGALDQSWADYFGDMTIQTEIENEEHADATITGLVQDQAALLGLLTRLVDMGLPLLLVQHVPNHMAENLGEQEE